MTVEQTIIHTRYGPLSVLPGGADGLITNFLIRNGEWAWNEVVFVAGSLDPGARVLDAGAFLGTFSLGLALRKQLGFLCAIEANAQVLPFLQQNLERNLPGVPTAIIGGLLVGTAGETRAGHVQERNLGSASFAEGATGGIPIEAPERVVTLAELRERHGPFDLIKLDIEGMELEALRGDSEYLSRGGTALWLECNEDPRSLEVVETILSWGLAVYYFAFPSHNLKNFRGDPEPIFAWAYEAGLLVAPKRPPELDPELAALGCILRPITSREGLEEALWRTPRWLPPELAHSDATELAAVAGRAMRGQARESFLRDPAPDTDTGSVALLWERMEAARAGSHRAEHSVAERRAELERARRPHQDVEADLKRAEELVHAMRGKLKHEQRIRESVEEKLATTAAVSLARLQELAAARQRAVMAEQQRAAAEARAAAAAAQLSAVHASTAWRLATPVHAFVDQRPRLRRAVRHGRLAFGGLVRRCRGLIQGLRR